MYSGVIRGEKFVWGTTFNRYKRKGVGKALQFLCIFTNIMLTSKGKLCLIQTLHATSSLG